MELNLTAALTEEKEEKEEPKEPAPETNEGIINALDLT